MMDRWDFIIAAMLMALLVASVALNCMNATQAETPAIRPIQTEVDADWHDDYIDDKCSTCPHCCISLDGGTDED